MPYSPKPTTPGIRPLIALVLATMLSFSWTVRAAEVVFHEGFDGPDPTWRLRATRHDTRLLRQSRARATASADPNRTIERIGISCPGGYSAMLEHAVGRLPVLDELTLAIALRSNRAGVQMAAEVVFPRSTDLTTGQPLRALVYSSRYSQPGRWQTLRLSRLPLLTERQARMLRTKPGQLVDVREAFVDRVVLVVPGHANESLIEVDEVNVTGVLASEAGQHSTASRSEAVPGTVSTAANREESDGLATAGPLLQSASGGDRAKDFAPVDVRRRGSAITVAGKPFVPRVLQYQGESFSMIAELGFNSVWMEQTPTSAQLRAAHDSRLWVLCPPPSPDVLRKINPTSPWQAVLAWSMGLDRDGLALDQVESLADETRLNDPLRRPVIVEASDRHRRYGRMADVVVARGKSPLIQRSRVADFQFQRALPLLGCSEWTSIDLEWSPAAVAQCKAFLPRARHVGWHEPREIHRLALEALASGSRGIVFRSRHRLGGSDPESRRLALQLKLINRDVALQEAWLVAGKRTGGVDFDGSDATTWLLGRSRLVSIPAQFDQRRDAPAKSSNGLASNGLVLTGVSETATAHLLTPGGLLPLSTTGTPGGRRFSPSDLAAGGLLLLTDDRRAIAGWKQRGAEGAEEATESLRMLTVAELLRLESIDGQLASNPSERRSTAIAQLKRGIRQCDLLLASKDYPRAAHLAQQLRHSIAFLEHQLAAKGVGRDKWQSVPSQYSLMTLPSHLALEDSLNSLPRSENILAGGDFEGFGQAKQAGWVHANHEHSPLETLVEFTSDRPQHGRASLRLSAKVKAGTDAVPGSRPAVWVTSPYVKARPGSVLEITGWVRVASPTDEKNQRATGELLIIDSLGGEELGLRIKEASDWQPFRLVRIVGAEGQVRLQLALNGPATADIDAVMIREVVRPAAASLTAGQASGTERAAQRLLRRPAPRR